MGMKLCYVKVNFPKYSKSKTPNKNILNIKYGLKFSLFFNGVT